MTFRFDVPRISGKLVYGVGSLGVTGSQVPSTGTSGPSLLYPTLSLPADANTEFSILILTRPSAGTLFVYEDSSFSFTGAPNGVYSFTFRKFTAGVQGSDYTVYLFVGVTDVNLVNVSQMQIAEGIMALDARGVPYVRIANYVYLSAGGQVVVIG